MGTLCVPRNPNVRLSVLRGVRFPPLPVCSPGALLLSGHLPLGRPHPQVGGRDATSLLSGWTRTLRSGPGWLWGGGSGRVCGSFGCSAHTDSARAGPRSFWPQVALRDVTSAPSIRGFTCPLAADVPPGSLWVWPLVTVGPGVATSHSSSFSCAALLPFCGFRWAFLSHSGRKSLRGGLALPTGLTALRTMSESRVDPGLTTVEGSTPLPSPAVCACPSPHVSQTCAAQREPRSQSRNPSAQLPMVTKASGLGLRAAVGLPSAPPSCGAACGLCAADLGASSHLRPFPPCGGQSPLWQASRAHFDV